MAAPAIWIDVDNTLCAQPTRVSVDGQSLGEVGPRKKTSVRTHAGPREICALARVRSAQLRRRPAPSARLPPRGLEPHRPLRKVTPLHVDVDVDVVIDAVVVAVVCLYAARVQAHDSVSDYV